MTPLGVMAVKAPVRTIGRGRLGTVGTVLALLILHVAAAEWWPRRTPALTG